MPTPAEQKALAFVALVIVLGGAVRVLRAGALAAPSAGPAEQQALARQTFSAGSAAAAAHERVGPKGAAPARGARKRRDAGAKKSATGASETGGDPPLHSGFPPPGPRIDVDMRAVGPVSPPPAWPAPPRLRVDLDVASAAEIERLPWVGPALARRIVASRDSLGFFGELAALGRVKGVGRTTLERLAPLVTFSAQTRR
jgi:competence protein ComEA